MTLATLLIVEDVKTHQVILQQMCSRFNYSSYVVGSGEEALEAMELSQYAAVVLDLHLPDARGYDVAKEIRRKEYEGDRRRTPIIAITSSLEDILRKECLEVGVDDFLLKPFHPEEFRKILLRHVYLPNQPNLLLLRESSEPPDDHGAY